MEEKTIVESLTYVKILDAHALLELSVIHTESYTLRSR